LEENITPIPNIPDAVKSAINKEELVIFVGAGVSRLKGIECAGWDQLSKALLKKCSELEDSTEKEGIKCINHKEYDTLSKINDHKKLITMCRGILFRAGLEKVFYQEMEKALKYTKDKEVYYQNIQRENIYDTIKKMGRYFVTTNVDNHFDKKFEDTQIVYEERHLRPGNIKKNHLYHIHGYIEDKTRNSLVFTASQYIQRYRKKHFIEFLNQLFKKTVLFIGYSLTEVELLTSIFPIEKSNKISTNGKKDNAKEISHYALKGYFLDETNIRNYEQYFYNDYKIKIIGFAKDENGYDQLIQVLEDWKKKIWDETSFLLDGITMLDRLESKL